MGKVSEHGSAYYQVSSVLTLSNTMQCAACRRQLQRSATI
jgi:hypothetical protein